MIDVLPTVLTPAVILTLIIIIIGVGLRTYSGMTGKSIKEVNWNLVIFTFLLSCITGISLVVPHIELALENPAITGSGILLLVANQIIVVYGSDALYKSPRVQSIAKSIKDKIKGGSPT